VVGSSPLVFRPDSTESETTVKYDATVTVSLRADPGTTGRLKQERSSQATWQVIVLCGPWIVRARPTRIEQGATEPPGVSVPAVSLAIRNIRSTNEGVPTC
jgi:hypothetical protein